MQYARSAALKCFVNKVDPDQAARESCLVMVHSVCLRRYEIKSYTSGYETGGICAIRSCGGFKTFFVNKVDPDQAALVRAAWSWSTMFAYGDMKCLIIVKWNLYARVTALNSFVNKVDLDQAAPVRTV